MTSALFEAGTLSPVSPDSSICSDAAWMIRPSAQTSSPAVSRTTSPTTTWSAPTLTSVPSRRTRADAFSIDCRAFMALSALPCWRMPPRALNAVIARTTMPVEISPITHRGDRCRHEDDLHVAPVLGQELLPDGRRRLGRERVRPVLLEQLGGPRRGEALGGVDVELRGDVLRRQRVPARRRAALVVGASGVWSSPDPFLNSGLQGVPSRTASGCWASRSPARRTRGRLGGFGIFSSCAGTARRGSGSAGGR